MAHLQFTDMQSSLLADSQAGHLANACRIENAFEDSLGHPVATSGP